MEETKKRECPTCGHVLPVSAKECWYCRDVIATRGSQVETSRDSQPESKRRSQNFLLTALFMGFGFLIIFGVKNLDQHLKKSRIASEGMSGENSRTTSGRESAHEKSVVAFLETWKSRGVARAAELSDPRFPDGIEAARVLEVLKSYANLRAVGESSLILRNTGDTIQVSEYATDAVVKMGDEFRPVQLGISVAKDSGRVYLVTPAGF